MMTSTFDGVRSEAAIKIETINSALTIWFDQHPACKSEIREYKTAQKWLETICGNDSDAAEHLKLTLALDWYRALFGHDWSN